MRKLAVLVLFACGKTPPAPTAAPLVVPAVAVTAAPAPAPRVPEAPRRAKYVIDHPELVGSEVTVRLVEGLYDSEHSSGADEGEYDVSVMDVAATRFKLVPGRTDAERREGALATLPAELAPPLLVRGVVAKTELGFAIVVRAIAPSTYPAPTRVAKAEDITTAPAKWDGQYVEVEGTWLSGFEGSFLEDTRIWLSQTGGTKARCTPPATKPRDAYGIRHDHVRLTGYVYAASGHYGHLGAYEAELVVTDVVFLDPKRPECR